MVSLKMGKIIYKKMSLFDAPEGSILVHACNAQGVWGSGIAKEFRESFPESFIEYSQFCQKIGHQAGTSLITQGENGYQIGCLITSENYGSQVDTKEHVSLQTVLALNDFFNWMEPQHKSIYSNKFNSGLFNVPWEETGKTLQYFVDRYEITWVVCDLSL
jgi:ADP-ribose 1''-phosphate phosphatase